jgi:hypothetical protein
MTLEEKKKVPADAADTADRKEEIVRLYLNICTVQVLYWLKQRARSGGCVEPISSGDADLLDASKCNA